MKVKRRKRQATAKRRVRVKRIPRTPYFITDGGFLSRTIGLQKRRRIVHGHHYDGETHSGKMGCIIAHMRWVDRRGKLHQRHVGMHTLVLEAFVRPRKKTEECRWRDGNKRNNRLSNISWVPIERTPIRGEDAKQSKLTEEQVIEVRERARNGELVEHFAHEYGFTPGGMRSVVNGSKWKHVPGALKRKSGPRPMPPEQRKKRLSRAADAPPGTRIGEV